LPRDQATLDMLDNMLGAAFTGQQTQLSPGATPGGQFMDPRFDAFMSDLTARQREREEIAQKAVVAKYEKFAETHEYFNDVRPYMAALIQAEADRGVVLSDEDAYEKACTLHPEVAPIVQQLKAAEAARRGNPRLQRSKAAGGSVRASPAGRMPAKEEGDQPDSVRGSIEKSIRQLEGRAKQ
jgi:arginyl-tRNA synthetase